MKVIDLSHIIEEKMPVFPGTEGPIIHDACTLEKNGFREKLLTLYSHTGTHMDAPAHMIEGSRIDALDVDHFVGPLLVITAKSYEVGLETVRRYEEEIKRVDFVLLKTNWDKKWGDDGYFSKFSALSKEAAEYLASFNLKGFGVDAISVDHMENSDFIVHHILLNKGFILIENLKNLDALKTGDLLSVLPLKIKDGGWFAHPSDWDEVIMLTKENVVDFTCDYLEGEGYSIIEGDADIVAQKDHLLKVIVYGAVSDASRTSQVGKSFNKNQIKMNIAMAVYETMKLKDHKTIFMIALPDNKLYGRVVKEIKVGLESFQIQLLLCNEQGLVKKII